MNGVGKPESKDQVDCLEPSRRSLFARKYHLVYLGLGSNIKPTEYLPRAVDLLCRYVGIESLSNAWETPPAGLIGQNFLNAAAAIRTQLPPGLLKNLILRPIEIQLGRVRTANKYAPRTIDLDILIFDDRLFETKIWSQVFLAVPLSELIPNFTNPETGENLQQAAAKLVELFPVKVRPEVLSGKPGAKPGV